MFLWVRRFLSLSSAETDCAFHHSRFVITATWETCSDTQPIQWEPNESKKKQEIYIKHIDDSRLRIEKGLFIYFHAWKTIFASVHTDLLVYKNLAFVNGISIEMEWQTNETNALNSFSIEIRWIYSSAKNFINRCVSVSIFIVWKFECRINASSLSISFGVAPFARNQFIVSQLIEDRSSFLFHSLSLCIFAGRKIN